jgi:hypothetical protein
MAVWDEYLPEKDRASTKPRDWANAVVSARVRPC